MHISRTDLNLFVVLDAIYTQGSITRASQVLNLSQPALSHALARLRTMFNDPLFVRQGAVMAATVIDHVTPAMRIYAEESFGPVKPIIRVKDADEAVRVANDTEYGLSAAVFGRDVRRAMAVAGRIDSGICHVNGPTVADEPQMPFGGVKDSGFGRFGGRAAIAEFTDLRWITLEDPDQHYPF